MRRLLRQPAARGPGTGPAHRGRAGRALETWRRAALPTGPLAARGGGGHLHLAVFSDTLAERRAEPTTYVIDLTRSGRRLPRFLSEVIRTQVRVHRPGSCRIRGSSTSDSRKTGALESLTKPDWRPRFPVLPGGFVSDSYDCRRLRNPLLSRVPGCERV